MDQDTWDRLSAALQEWPQTSPGPATEEEVGEAERQVGLRFPEDYWEFLLRCGGGDVGPITFLGMRRPQSMVRGQTLVDRNAWFHGQGWPGLNPVLVISDDDSGNPIGIGPDGRVWRSDHNGAYVYDFMADSFETILRGCLGAPIPDHGYDDFATVWRRMAEEQQALLDHLGLTGKVADPRRDHIWVEAPWDALDEPDLMVRSVDPGKGAEPDLKLWRLTPRHRPDATPDDRNVGLGTLWRLRPVVTKVLALPQGYTACVAGDAVESIVDPDGLQVYGA